MKNLLLNVLTVHEFVFQLKYFIKIGNEFNLNLDLICRKINVVLRETLRKERVKTTRLVVE